MSDVDQIVTKIGVLTTISTTNAINQDGMSVDRTFQATLTGTGAVSATVVFEVSNDGVGWLSDENSTFVISGTNLTSVGFTSKAPWGYVRGKVLAISGTSASVTFTVGG